MKQTLRFRRFQSTIWQYFREHRRDLPWRPPSLPLRKDGTADPYAVLVSEMMLQQTQVERVIPKYLAWMNRFPTLESLAGAKTAEVLRLWQGLGYNRRVRNLKRAAETIVNELGGVFPRTIAAIDALPGIGPYTAGAVAAFALGTPSAFIETNIRTVFLHFFFKNRREVRDGEILEIVAATLPNKISGSRGSTSLPIRGRTSTPWSVREWYYALMDYGAMLKRTVGNQNARSAHYARQSAFIGSRREVRGVILRRAAEQKTISVDEVMSKAHSVSDIFAELVAEGFLRKQGARFTLA